MPKHSILIAIKKIRRPLFTTHELSTISGSSLSSITQSLNLLQKKGLVFKIARGIWAEVENERLSPYMVIPLLFPKHRAYVSFISALHLYGIIEQIPQTITLASTVHTRIIHTTIATFTLHQITASFFSGFDWYKGTGNFLVAEPEKALLDSLYLSARKKRQFGYFPELHFSEAFSFEKAEEWTKRISDPKIKISVLKKLERIKKNYKSVD
ncbi:hypothetical protein ACFL1T_02780 [Chlamydiota bacterium]